MSNTPTRDPRRSPIFDRLTAVPPAKTPPAPPRAVPKPKMAPTEIEDFYLARALEHGTRFNVRFMNGDELRGCVITAVSKFAITIRSSDGTENYCFKHGITRLERTDAKEERAL